MVSSPKEARGKQGLPIYYKWNFLLCNCFCPLRKQCSIYSLLVESRISKNSGIMHSSRPSNVNVGESIQMIDHSLHDNRMPPFAVKVVGWKVTGRHDRNVRPIHRTSTLRKSPLVLETTNYFLERIPSILLKIWCWHNTFRGVNKPFKYNTPRVLWEGVG